MIRPQQFTGSRERERAVSILAQKPQAGEGTQQPVGMWPAEVQLGRDIVRRLGSGTQGIEDPKPDAGSGSAIVQKECPSPIPVDCSSRSSSGIWDAA